MTREQINQILIEGGVETPSKLMISALLNAINEEKKTAVEEATKTAEEKAKESFKDYKTAEEYQTLERELADLKDSKAKTERTSKYAAKGISEKYHDYADSKLKDSKDFDKDLDEFIKNNAELVSKAKEEPKPQPKQIVFGKVETNQGTPTTAGTMRSAVAEYYENQKK